MVREIFKADLSNLDGRYQMERLRDLFSRIGAKCPTDHNCVVMGSRLKALSERIHDLKASGICATKRDDSLGAYSYYIMSELETKIYLL